MNHKWQEINLNLDEACYELQAKWRHHDDHHNYNNFHDNSSNNTSYRALYELSQYWWSAIGRIWWKYFNRTNDNEH